MMIFEHIRNIFTIPELRKKILFTVALLVVFRLGSLVPIPGLHLDQLAGLKAEMAGGDYAGLIVFFGAISGGALANLGIFSLGIMPYISASIIFSLLTKVIPKLEEISKEGTAGQRKINEWTRYATLPLCLVQAWFIVNLLTSTQLQGGLFIAPQTWGFRLTALLTLTVGGIFLMWLGEQITEYGVTNGISLLIMAGIVASLPQIVNLLRANIVGSLGQAIALGVFFSLGFVAVVAGVVTMDEGQRRIPVQQAKHTRGRRVYGGQKSHMPLKVNQAGVMPVIFASSLMIFPTTIGAILKADWLTNLFTVQSFWYVMFYVVLIYFFSYFWTSLMFQPTEMAKQLKEYGSFVPGIRPGQKTADFLEGIMSRITFVGAGFLCIIALLPQMILLPVQWFIIPGETLSTATIMAAQFMGGTGILIVVGVILELVRKIESHLLMRHYEGFLGGPGGGSAPKGGRRRR